MFFGIFVIGVLLTTVLYTWFTFNYYGGVHKVLVAFCANIRVDKFPALGLVSLIMGFYFVLSLLAWPLILIFLVLVLAKRFNQTGSFGVDVPNEVPVE